MFRTKIKSFPFHEICIREKWDLLIQHYGVWINHLPLLLRWSSRNFFFLTFRRSMFTNIEIFDFNGRSISNQNIRSTTSVGGSEPKNVMDVKESRRNGRRKSRRSVPSTILHNRLFRSSFLCDNTNEFYM